jgi:hypothetical protein
MRGGKVSRRVAHLHRTWYQTDAQTSEPEYMGTFSGTVPMDDERQIVNVEWDKPGKGWIEVTFLIPGESHLESDPYPWPIQ